MKHSPTRRLVLALAIGAAAHAGLAAQGPRPAPDVLARSLQQRYQGISDFTADFVHTYRGGVLRTQTQERGTVVIKKPSRMRWTYTTPEKKEFVSDGVKVYSYIPEDRQVIVSSVPRDDPPPRRPCSWPAKATLPEIFQPLMPTPSWPGRSRSNSRPGAASPTMSTSVVALDPASLQIRSLTTRDRQGGDSTLVFTNLKENQRISDKEFAFRIPRGVDVITDGPSN